MVISAYFSLIRGLYKIQIRCASPTRFRLLCPLFEELQEKMGTTVWTFFRWESPLESRIVERIELGGNYAKTNYRSGSGLRWKQGRFNSWRWMGPPNPLLRLVALESSLGNKTDGWVNLTQNWSNTEMLDNYYYRTPSYYNHLVVDGWGGKTIRHQVHLSVRITREEAAAGMWSPEPIKVPCLVELEAFELIVKFQPAPGALRMSDLRGSGPGIMLVPTNSIVASIVC